MEQTVIEIRQQALTNPYTYDEVLQAVINAVESAGLSMFKAFLNDYKIIPEIQSKAA